MVIIEKQDVIRLGAAVALALIIGFCIHKAVETVFYLQDQSAKYEQVKKTCDTALAFMAKYAEPQEFYSVGD